VLEGSTLDHRSAVVATVLITVGLSVYAHGLMAVPLSVAYAHWFAGCADAPAMENAAAHESRLRPPRR
jgi:hypothetical protein